MYMAFVSLAEPIILLSIYNLPPINWIAFHEPGTPLPVFVFEILK